MEASNASSRHIQAVPDQAPAGTRRPLGEILIELGFVTRAELDSAREVQRKTGDRIGEILVDQGRLTRIDLACALAEQWEPYPNAEEDESLESSLTGAVRSATEQSAPELQPEPQLVPQEGVDQAVEELSRSVAGLTSARAADALAMGARFATVEQAIADLSGLEARLRADHDRSLAEGFREVTLRLEAIERRHDQIAELEARVGSVSELAVELRGELRSPARPGGEPDDRLLELSLRIDRAARDSHDRIVALADELRADVAAKSAGFDARLKAQLEDGVALQRRLEEVQAAVSGTLPGAGESTAELHVEIGSLAGRLDELFGLRHADAQVARVANERLAARLEGLVARQADEAAAALAVAMDARDEPGVVEARFEEGLDRLAADVAELARRLERQDAVVAESSRATERAVLEGLVALGKQLTGKRSKKGKASKSLRRSIDSLGAAIAAADARLAEQSVPAQPDS